MVLSRILLCASLSITAVVLHGCGGGGDSPSPSPAPAPLIGSCGAAKDVEDCQNVDFGTCGGACCRVQATVQGSVEDVAKALNTSLMNGGPDGGYTLQPLWGNGFAGGAGTGFESLGGADGYLGQVHHITSIARYNDTINFHLTSSADNKTATITAFSLSLIGGALGDAGQNFKNIIMALNGANFGNGAWDGKVVNMDASCPQKSQTEAQASTSEDLEVKARRLKRADVVGTCGFSGNVTDCDHPDLGSCGNACCSLTVMVNGTVDDAVKTLNASFAKGGADGNFTPSFLAEGVTGFANLSGIAPSEMYPNGIFIGQVEHATNGMYKFTDVLDFNLVGTGNGQAKITAFSLSLVGGAYGDAGQNYKNLKMAIDHAFPSATIEPGNFPKSCPKESSMLI